jgi:hypothetical protein
MAVPDPRSQRPMLDERLTARQAEMSILLSLSSPFSPRWSHGYYLAQFRTIPLVDSASQQTPGNDWIALPFEL